MSSGGTYYDMTERQRAKAAASLQRLVADQRAVPISASGRPKNEGRKKARTATSPGRHGMTSDHRGLNAARRYAREQRRREKVQAKDARRDQRRAERAEQFPSAWPDAPEPVAGVGRTLSRGLP